jgi:hypothetical protein
MRVGSLWYKKRTADINGFCPASPDDLHRPTGGVLATGGVSAALAAIAHPFCTETPPDTRDHCGPSAQASAHFFWCLPRQLPAGCWWPAFGGGGVELGETAGQLPAFALGEGAEDVPVVLLDGLTQLGQG